MFENWYTDTVSTYRITTATDDLEDGISHDTRVQVLDSVPCRVYSTSIQSPSMRSTEAIINKTDKLAVPIGTDIKEGDELIVTRGAVLGYTKQTRYIAGSIQSFYDPVGGLMTSLNHMEVGLLDENIME